MVRVIIHKIMLPSVEKENYFNELATFQVENTNPEKERDIVYTPHGISSGLVINEPNTGMIEGNELITLDGEIENEETIMIQLIKDDHSWQHIAPVNEGRFFYNIPLFYGKGIHEVHVLIPDKELERSVSI